MKWGFALLFAAVAGLAAAQSWYEPQRGTPERRALMDAFRPLAEEIFGAPVEFVVGSLRVSGNVAFASVVAQRPGGAAIDVARTPGWLGGYFMPDADWTGGQALFRRAGSGWVFADGGFGATDVWWSTPQYCNEFLPVIAEACP
jgi:hypothetical protein